MADRRVAVIGAGSWGTTVAALLAVRSETLLWARRADCAAEIVASQRNRAYLGSTPLPATLGATSSLAEAIAGRDLVVVAVPTHGVREVLSRAAPHLAPGVPLLSLAKGFEEGTLLRMTEVLDEVCPGHPLAVLTGPSLAAEVLAGEPTATVVASGDPALALELQGLLGTAALRVYTNADVVGCEVAGALKNVMAIASGMAVGLGLGDNARAALITRSLAELTRLGTALGGDPRTFAGLAGLGDLVVTCTSERSRNRAVGVELARGRPLVDVLAATTMIAEGVRTCRAVVELAHSLGVDVPIAEQVAAVLYGGKAPSETIAALMSRTMKQEMDGFEG